MTCILECVSFYFQQFLSGWIWGLMACPSSHHRFNSFKFLLGKRVLNTANIHWSSKVVVQFSDIDKIQCCQKFLQWHSLTYLTMCKIKNIECPVIFFCDSTLAFHFYSTGVSVACQILLSKFEFGISLLRICINPYHHVICCIKSHKIFAYRVFAVWNLSVLHLGFHLKQWGNILPFLPYSKWFCSPPVGFCVLSPK